MTERAGTVHTAHGDLVCAESGLVYTLRGQDYRGKADGTSKGRGKQTRLARAPTQREGGPLPASSALPVLARLPRLAQGSQLVELPRVSAWATRLGLG